MRPSIARRLSVSGAWVSRFVQYQAGPSCSLTPPVGEPPPAAGELLLHIDQRAGAVYPDQVAVAGWAKSAVRDLAVLPDSILELIQPALEGRRRGIGVFPDDHLVIRCPGLTGIDRVMTVMTTSEKQEK